MRSYLPDYDLVEAKDIDTVLELLRGPEGWRPIAGGTDLMVLFNAGHLPYKRLAGIRSIPELSRITVTPQTVSIGAAVTYTQLRQHELLRAEFPLLCQAASWTGGIANQNRGTLGGNIINASPAADSPPALLIYDAELTLLSTTGPRHIQYSDFHTGYKQMRMQPDELLYEITLPRRAEKWRQYSRKVGARKAQAISKVCLAAAARMDGSVIRDVRIALGSVAPVPLRCTKTEATLRGRELTSSRIAEAQQILAKEIQPIDDIRSTAQYRSMVAHNLLAQSLASFL
jgi:CO/xanthine dehydrogenase FAD-binding subunit